MRYGTCVSFGSPAPALPGTKDYGRAGVTSCRSRPIGFRRSQYDCGVKRPSQFEHFRFVGDKRTQVVYDIDHLDDSALAMIDELMASKMFQSFGPDTLAEARNRSYKLYLGPAAGPDSGKVEMADGAEE